MIVILAGAGASKAVNGDMYPDTKEFLKRLPDDVKGNLWYQLIMEYLTEAHSGQTVDIEHVLGAAQSIDEVCRTFYDRPGPIEFVFTKDRVKKLAPGLADLGQFITAVQHVNQQFRAVSNNINKEVYDLYKVQPEETDLQHNWLQLFNRLEAEHPAPVQLFTTNYDLVIEEAIRLGKAKFETGRKQDGQYTRLTQSHWKKPDLSESLFTKLHGSVDWQRKVGDEHIYYGNGQFTGDHANHVILYPALKDEPVAEPFAMFHRYFEASVAHATAVVVIGFAFRDPAINRVLQYVRPVGTPLIVIDPSDPLKPHAHWRGTHKRIVDGFGLESIDEALDHVKSLRKSAKP